MLVSLVVREDNERKYERKTVELKFSYKSLEGKHKDVIPEAGYETVEKEGETILVEVIIEEGTTSYILAFKQRMLHHLDAKITSQEKVIR
ncbi:hypothetical protein PVK06_035576 [Gossypium arboreum]|uniref:Uncharacterized protein n=1 Tax=Gossypium arboreum TaxID=29729 RepID=A0ABR0NHQ0_GOSAR|nr:hypothetical protein PVK06_035576 [Gossypium arboreum]